MAPLIFPRLAFCVKKIADGGAAQGDSFVKNFLQGFSQLSRLIRRTFGCDTHGMNFRMPQALVGVDIADASQCALIEQESFDARFAGFQERGEFRFGDFKRVSPKAAQFCRQVFGGQIRHAAEAASVGIAKFAAIVEEKSRVRVFRKWFGGGMRRKMASHAEMHEQRTRSVWMDGNAILCAGKAHQHEFSKAFHALDELSRQVPLERGWIINEIGFAQRDGHDAPPGNGLLQATSERFHFRKFWHKRIRQSYHSANQLLMAA